MKLFYIIFCSLYVLLLLFYFKNETGGNFTKRAVNKTALSTMFVTNFLICFFANSTPITFMSIIALCAFIFCFFADIVLLFDFIKGAVVFAVGNLCFTVYSFLLLARNNIAFTQVWWCAIIFVVIIVSYLIAVKLLKMNYKKFGAKLPAYLVTVTLHGSLGVAIAVSSSELSEKIFGIGLIMFMISDYLLVTYKIYRKSKLMLRMNSGLYFIGIMLASLSFC